MHGHLREQKGEKSIDEYDHLHPEIRMYYSYIHYSY